MTRRMIQKASFLVTCFDGTGPISCEVTPTPSAMADWRETSLGRRRFLKRDTLKTRPLMGHAQFPIHKSRRASTRLGFRPPARPSVKQQASSIHPLPCAERRTILLSTRPPTPPYKTAIHVCHRHIIRRRSKLKNSNRKPSTPPFHHQYRCYHHASLWFFWGL